MKCPACRRTLKQKMVEDIELDVCESGCGGIWFDRDEILKFDEPHEFSDSKILEINKDSSVKVTHEGPRQCPKCEDEVLARQFFDPKHEVEIDQCWNCAGIWLDTGELLAIRNQYASYEERSKAVNTYLEGALTGHHDAIKAATDERIREHREKYDNVFTSFVSGLKDLLGIG